MASQGTGGAVDRRIVKLREHAKANRLHAAHAAEKHGKREGEQQPPAASEGKP